MKISQHLGLYIGCPIKVTNPEYVNGGYIGILAGVVNDEPFVLHPELFDSGKKLLKFEREGTWKLQLKSIANISEDDATELMKIVMSAKQIDDGWDYENKTKYGNGGATFVFLGEHKGTSLDIYGDGSGITLWHKDNSMEELTNHEAVCFLLRRGYLVNILPDTNLVTLNLAELI